MYKHREGNRCIYLGSRQAASPQGATYEVIEETTAKWSGLYLSTYCAVEIIGVLLMLMANK